MTIEYSKLALLVKDILRKWKFPENDLDVIFHNLEAAELSGKKSHGFGNLLWFKDVIDGKYGKLNLDGKKPVIEKETAVSLVIDGKEKTGYVVMDFALNESLKKVKEQGIIATTLTHTLPTIGYIGGWARKAATSGFIFICFSNAGASTSPYGTTKKIFGTNPIAFGIPTNNDPVILDMATAATTYAQLLRARNQHKTFDDNVGINANGDLTNDAEVILNGGSMIPFGGYKGSGISLMVEILAGALTTSKTGLNGVPYWGTMFLLIDPALFGSKEEFTARVSALLNDIKTAPKRMGMEQVYYPGEQSYMQYQQNIQQSMVEIDDLTLEKLQALL